MTRKPRSFSLSTVKDELSTAQQAIVEMRSDSPSARS